MNIGHGTSTQFGSDHYLIFLAHLLRDESLLFQADRQLEPHLISQMSGEKGHAVVFYTIRAFYRRYKVAPDKPMLMAELKEFIARHAQTPEHKKQLATVLGRFLSFCDTVTDASLQMAYDVLNSIINLMRVQPEIQQAIVEGQADGNYERMAKRIEALTSQSTQAVKSLTMTGVTDIPEEDGGERLPTYIQWFDKRVGNPGPVRGGSMGILSPPGGGKTTLGVHLGVEQSLATVYAMLILVEEFSRQVRRKILACATSIPTPILEECGDDIEKVIATQGLDPELVMAKKRAVDTYLQVVDLTKEGDTNTVRAELSRLRQYGTMPSYVYLDWAGCLADRLVLSDKRFTDNRRAAIMHIADETARWAKEYDVFCAVSHQMKSETASRGPFVRSSQFDAMDCQSFSVPLKYCLVINPRDENTQLQVTRMDKTRDDKPPAPFTLRLRGELSRFEDASEAYSVNAGGRIVRNARRDRDEGALPEED